MSDQSNPFNPFEQAMSMKGSEAQTCSHPRQTRSPSQQPRRKRRRQSTSEATRQRQTPLKTRRYPERRQKRVLQHRLLQIDIRCLAG